VAKVRDTDSPEAVRRLAGERSRSRYVVIDRGGQALGVINVLDVLLHEPDRCPPIRQLMHEPLRIAETLPLREGLTRLQRQRQSLAIVVGHRNQPVGVVTIKDLVEPITGELSAW
jgi:CBS domain containing-hemolysin-like protein